MLDYNVQRDCNLTQIGGNLCLRFPLAFSSPYNFMSFQSLSLILLFPKVSSTPKVSCNNIITGVNLFTSPLNNFFFDNAKPKKGYGIATPKGSIWRDKISLAILELQEKGEIQILYDKWWKNTEETCVRDEKHKDSKANSLGVGNIGGVFVVLLCGLAFAVLVAIAEFCYKTKKDNFNDPLQIISSKNSLCAEMTDELCFALSCKNANHQRQAFKKTICNECRNSNNLFLKSQSNMMMNDVM